MGREREASNSLGFAEIHPSQVPAGCEGAARSASSPRNPGRRAEPRPGRINPNLLGRILESNRHRIHHPSHPNARPSPLPWVGLAHQPPLPLPLTPPPDRSPTALVASRHDGRGALAAAAAAAEPGGPEGGVRAGPRRQGRRVPCRARGRGRGGGRGRCGHGAQGGVAGGGAAEEGVRARGRGRGRPPADLVRAGRAPGAAPPAAPLAPRRPRHRRRRRVRHRPLRRRRPQLAPPATDREDVLRLRHPVLRGGAGAGARVPAQPRHRLPGPQAGKRPHSGQRPHHARRLRPLHAAPGAAAGAGRGGGQFQTGAFGQPSIPCPREAKEANGGRPVLPIPYRQRRSEAGRACGLAVAAVHLADGLLIVLVLDGDHGLLRGLGWRSDAGQVELVRRHRGLRGAGDHRRARPRLRRRLVGPGSGDLRDALRPHAVPGAEPQGDLLPRAHQAAGARRRADAAARPHRSPPRKGPREARRRAQRQGAPLLRRRRLGAHSPRGAPALHPDAAAGRGRRRGA